MLMLLQGDGLQHRFGEADAAPCGSSAEVLHMPSAQTQLPGGSTLFTLGSEVTHQADVAQSLTCYSLQGIQFTCPYYPRHILHILTLYYINYIILLNFRQRT